MEKSPDAFRTISEVASEIGLPQHVLRFWETRFVQIKPLKRGGGRRYYRPDDVDLLKSIQMLLYSEGYTIRGVQRLLKEQGPKAVAGFGRGQALPDKTAILDSAPDGEDAADMATDMAPGPAEEDCDPDEAPLDDRLLHQQDQVFSENRAQFVANLELALAELAECSRLLDRVRTQ